MKNTTLILSFLFTLLAPTVWADTFSPDGTLFTEKTTDKVKVWNLETGENIYSFDISKPLLLNDRGNKADLTKEYVIKTISFDGRYVVLAGYEDFKMYDKWRSARATVYLDMKENKVTRAYIEESRYAHKEYFFSSPNSYEFAFCDVAYNKEKPYTNIRYRHFDSSESTSLRIKGDPKAPGYDNAQGYGRIVSREGTLYYAATYTDGTQLFDLSRLEEEVKPIKLKVKKNNLYNLTNNNLTIIYKKKEDALFENGKRMASASNFDYNKRNFTSFFVAGTTLISQCNGKAHEVRIFDYSTNTYTPIVKLYEEEHEWIKFSENGRYLIVKFASGKKVYDMVKGTLLSELNGDDEYILLAENYYNQAAYNEAITLLKKVSEEGQGRKDYHLISFFANASLANNTIASNHLKAIDYAIETIDYPLAARSLVDAGNTQKALDLLWEYQKYDIRITAEELEQTFPTLDGNESFEMLVAATLAVDNYSGPYDVEKLGKMMDAKAGLYELKIKDVYGILNAYKTTGLDAALSDAKYVLSNARKYALTPNGKAATYTILGNAYMKTDFLVEAYQQYNLALSVDTTVDYFYIELATVCQEIKGILAEELSTMKQVSWPNDLREDYLAMDKQTKDLTTAYIEQFPEDPMGYYVRAMSKTSLTYDNYKPRMKDAEKALLLFKKMGLEAPEYCKQMADRYFGIVITTTASASAGCNSSCTHCGGLGSENKSEQCGTCSGTGKNGTCRSCNGRGRKYDTTRNQQVCYTCSGSGRLPCYTCSSTGRKSKRSNCSHCNGSGCD